MISFAKEAWPFVLPVVVPGLLLLFTDWRKAGITLIVLGLLILLFMLLVIPVNALIFRPIFRVLDAREEKSSGTRTRADRLEREATQTLERYEREVGQVRVEAESRRREKLESARSEGAEQLAQARSDAESELERARSEIASAMAEARGRLRQQAEELAAEAATRVLGRSLS